VFDLPTKDIPVQPQDAFAFFGMGWVGFGLVWSGVFFFFFFFGDVKNLECFQMFKKTRQVYTREIKVSQILSKKNNK
jgi:hypothetical protein